MTRTHTMFAAAALFTLGVSIPRELAASDSIPAPRRTESRVVRLDGAAQKVGNGTVRTYILFDALNPNVAVEVGVALSEKAMEGLPAPMKMNHTNSSEHLDMHNWILDLPSKNPTPYTFVQFGWNPQGHEPPGVWDVPHFDFHFWTASKQVRSSILPTDPQFAEKAAKYPAKELLPQFYLDAATAGRVTPAQATVPEMGVHWVDVRTPEVQAIAGKPEAYKPFTKTFIYGTWNGDFVFAEPMITRAYLLEKRATKDAAVRDEEIAVPTAGFPQPGRYAQSYRIMFDAKTREYRIALTNFSKRD